MSFQTSILAIMISGLLTFCSPMAWSANCYWPEDAECIDLIGGFSTTPCKTGKCLLQNGAPKCEVDKDYRVGDTVQGRATMGDGSGFTQWAVGDEVICLESRPCASFCGLPEAGFPHGKCQESAGAWSSEATYNNFNVVAGSPTCGGQGGGGCCQ